MTLQVSKDITPMVGVNETLETGQERFLSVLAPTNQKQVLTNQNTTDPGIDTPGQCRHHSHGQY